MEDTNRLDGLILRIPYHASLTYIYIYRSSYKSDIPTICLDTRIACSNPGFMQMSAALLAMEIFNARNASVVPELGDPVFQECAIQMDLENSLVFNTQSKGHQASQRFSAQPKPPCAMVGPYNDVPAEELSVLATSLKIPLTVNRAFNLRVVSDVTSPYSSQLYPYMPSSVQNLVDYLLLRDRTDFIATVYAFSDTGTQLSETISLFFSEYMISHEMVSYSLPIEDSLRFDTRTARNALEKVKNLGFRTIILVLESALGEFPLIADAAEELELNNGDYLWIMFGDEESEIFRTNNTNINKLLNGAAFLSPLIPEATPITRAWIEQNGTMADKLNAFNPIEPGETGYFFAEPNFFETYFPFYGDVVMFDAVMATAMGACLADRDDVNNTGLAHVRGIRSVDFQGASGPVKFERGSAGQGVRESSTFEWGVFNLIFTPDEGFVSANVTDIYSNGTWTKLGDFVYADGTTSPPKLLRDVPDQNYLNGAIRAVGLSLMGIIMLGAVASCIWVYIHREHRVLRAAQPIALYVIAFGSAVSASSIFVISFDENEGWTEEQLSRACMTIPWLVSLGHLITYGALFSKLWRINEVLQFSRRKIDMKHVAWPFAMLAFLTVVILSVWTALDSLQWNRVELNESTGESIGRCQSDQIAAFLVPLVVLLLIPTVLTGCMAWKTKDIDEVYSESQWIFIMIVSQFEIILVAVPTIAVLLELSADGRYIGFAFLVWSFPSTALGFIILPKVVAYYRAIRGNDRNNVPKRGNANGTVHVTGLTTTTSSQDRVLLDSDAARSYGGEPTEQLSDKESR
jgi:hypothetical protein